MTLIYAYIKKLEYNVFISLPFFKKKLTRSVIENYNMN